jgi:hypothetical protein
MARSRHDPLIFSGDLLALAEQRTESEVALELDELRRAGPLGGDWTRGLDPEVVRRVADVLARPDLDERVIECWSGRKRVGYWTRRRFLDAAVYSLRVDALMRRHGHERTNEAREYGLGILDAVASDDLAQLDRSEVLEDAWMVPERPESFDGVRVRSVYHRRPVPPTRTVARTVSVLAVGRARRRERRSARSSRSRGSPDPPSDDDPSSCDVAGCGGRR